MPWTPPPTDTVLGPSTGGAADDGPWTAYQKDPPVTDGPWSSYARTADAAVLARPQVSAPGGLLNAIIAGYQSSATGLILRGENPSTVLPKDAPWYERGASNIAGVIADLPEMVAGGVGGGAAGGVAGGAVAGPPGAVTGAVIGTGAGAFAVPTALRDALMTAYSQGSARSWSDVWEIIKAGAEGGGKGALIGGLTAGAGRAAQVFTRTATPAVGVAAKTGAEITTLATAGAALDGHIPTAQDFLDAAVVVGGLHAAGKVAGRLREIYARTGVRPEQVAVEAKADPQLRDELTREGQQAEPSASGPAASEPRQGELFPDIPARYRPLAEEQNARAAIPDPDPVADYLRAEEFANQPAAKIPQQPGEPTRPTHVNYNYINSQEDIGPALSRLSQLYEEQIQAQRRSTVSRAQSMWEAQQMLADTLGVDRHKIGAAANAAELYARNQLAQGAAEELMRKGKIIADLGDAATPEQVANYLAHIERTGLILSDFLGARAEAGRALNMLKETRRAAVDIQQMKEIIDTYGGRESIAELAKKMSEARDRTAVLNMVRPTLSAKLVEAWKALILTGPTTHQANILGNTLATAMRFPERAMAAAIGTLHGGEKVHPAEVAALGAGMVRGALDGLKVAGEVLKGKEPLSGKVEAPREAISGKKGKVIRFSFRALSAEDALFRTMNEQGEAYALATRQAINEGLTRGTNEFNARVVDIVQNPTDEVSKAVQAAGDRAVFTDRLGRVGTHLQRMVHGTPLEFVIPFIKTPANLIKWAARYTPGVNMLMPSVRADLSGVNGLAARDMALSRMVIGGVTATIVIEAVHSGTLTGGGLTEPDKFSARWAAGWRPYSIKIGGEYYSYARLDPVARLLSTVADAAEIYDAMGENADLNVGGVMVAAIGNATVSQTYLSGLANAINAVTDPDRYGPSWVDSYAASIVPSLLGQTAVALDPNTREVNSWLEAIQSRIPILREQLMPRRNPLTGEPNAATGRLWPLSPIQVSEVSRDKVLTEAARLGIHLPKAPKKIHIGRGTGKKGDVEITPEARNVYTREQGQFAHEILSQLVRSPMWDVLPDAAQANIYKKVLTSARKRAALIALPPEARIAEVLRITNELMDENTAKLPESNP